MEHLEKAYLDVCQHCGHARADFRSEPEEKETLYQCCVELGQALGRSSYEIEREIEKHIGEGY